MDASSASASARVCRCSGSVLSQPDAAGAVEMKDGHSMNVTVDRRLDWNCNWNTVDSITYTPISCKQGGSLQVATAERTENRYGKLAGKHPITHKRRTRHGRSRMYDVSC